MKTKKKTTGGTPGSHSDFIDVIKFTIKLIAKIGALLILSTGSVIFMNDGDYFVAVLIIAVGAFIFSIDIKI